MTQAGKHWKSPVLLSVLAVYPLLVLGWSHKAKDEPGIRGAAAPAGMLVVRTSQDLKKLNQSIKSMSGAGGGQVYFPAGTYAIDEPVMLGSNITLRGDGPGTVLTPSERFDQFLRERNVYGGASDVSIFFQPRGDHYGVINAKGASAVRVSDLSIHGNRENVRAVAGVMIYDSEDIIVRGVTVEDCGASGITVLRGREVDLLEIRSRRNHNGIIISGPPEHTRNISVTNCRISDNRWSGIYLCGDGAGAARAANGPANVIISNNFVLRHMCDEGIKCYGVTDVIVTGNRIDYALEAGVSADGQNLVVANNICSHVDDGMNNKGNGTAITYGNRTGDRLNMVIEGNICRDGNSGIWSEGFRTSGGRHLPLGRVSLVGNICVDNVTAGIGHIMKTDLTCVGNVCVDNGHSRPDPQSPAEANMGIIVGGGTKRTMLVGNVISDTREEPHKRLMYGLLLRGCDEGVASYNYVSGCKDANIREQAPGPHYVNERNGDDLVAPPGQR